MNEYQKKENNPVICEQMTVESLLFFADTFGIPVAGEKEEGTPVRLQYFQKERYSGLFNGGGVLQDERPWNMVAPLARHVILRGARGSFEIRLLYKRGEYKLQEIVFE